MCSVVELPKSVEDRELHWIRLVAETQIRRLFQSLVSGDSGIRNQSPAGRAVCPYPRLRIEPKYISQDSVLPQPLQSLQGVALEVFKPNDDCEISAIWGIA